MHHAGLKTHQFLFFALALLVSSSAGQAKGADPQLAQRIDDYLTQNTERGFSGAVLIVEDNEIILSKGYGLANKEENISNTPQTVFDIGSLTKQFTGAAILKLVEQGKLDVTDPLGNFFENAPADKQVITLHQLLTHTAGLPEYSGDDYDFVGTEKYLKKIFNRKLKFTPGERFEYSNVGYSLLAHIVEKISGDEYEEFLNETLFQAAGMTNTGYFIPNWGERVVAQGYNYPRKKHWGSNIERWAEDGGISWHLKGNGGILSTVEDMYKWHLALEGHEILPPDLKALYEAPHVDAGRSQFYGYGWRSVKTADDEKVVFHNGGNMIFFATVRRFVDQGRVVIFMTNEGRLDVYRMSRQIETIIADPELEPELIAVPSRKGRMRAWLQQFGL